MSDAHRDPLTADRRTLLVAVVAMVALVMVGVVSAALFTRSACSAIVPSELPPRPAGADLVATLHDAYPQADAADLEAVQTAVTTLAGTLGPVLGVADVSGAQRLAVVDAGGVVAATGPTTTVLADGGRRVDATAELGDGTVVGSGDGLFAVALTNPLTGQVDAVLPLGPDLEPGTCTDTAVVGEPFAFHLDAADGGLLLFRVDEDADDPELELVSEPDARRWLLEIETGIAPPGVLAERLTGRLGDEVAVVGRRTAPGDEAPVVTAVDLAAGRVRWTIDRARLGAVLSPDTPDGVEVRVVGERVAVVGTTPDTGQDGQGGPGAGARVTAIDLTDGSVVWTHELAPPFGLVDAVGDGDEVVVLGRVDGDSEVVRIRSGDVVAAAQLPGEMDRLVALPDRQLAVLGPAGVAVVNGVRGGEVVVRAGLASHDVVVHDGRLTVLLAGPDGGSVAVTFGR